MSRLLPSALISAALSLCSLHGAEPQAAMPPALLEAIAGNEPYASLVEYGLPLISATEEVEALPAELRQSQATAIKKVLMAQMVRARNERHRVTAENYEACAQMAHEQGTPLVFAIYQQLLAEGELSAREAYTVRSALGRLYEDYRVDALALRYFVEGSRLAADDLRDSLDWLPVEDLFNLIPRSALTPENAERDFEKLQTLLPEITAVYRSIDSPAAAESALPQLLQLLPQFESTVGSRKFLEPEHLAPLLQKYGPKISPLFTELNAQRERLKEANYYDSVRLRVLDYLMN